MSLKYLSKYLNEDGSKPSKRKKGNNRIVEDNLTGWSTDFAPSNTDDSPTVLEGGQSLRRPTGFLPAYTQEDTNATALSGGHESIMKKSQQTDQPRLSTGARAGLQTKEQAAADAEARRIAQKEELLRASANSSSAEHETIYRDATGRRIDISLAKREKAQEAKREKERQVKQQEMRQGLVQQQQKEERRKDLEQAKTETFSRYAGNLDAERSLRERDRWDDPAAGFLTAKYGPHSSGDIAARPSYKGGYAPNRFSIRPGHRWDGVDRGNGFEAKRFREIANQNQRRQEYDDWAREDM